MARILGFGLVAGLASIGCFSKPPLDNPAPVRQASDEIENPVLVSPGVPTSTSYQEVFEKCVDVIDDYFEIGESNPYAGHIATKPRIAPGFEQLWKGGNPDTRERLLVFQVVVAVGQERAPLRDAGDGGGARTERIDADRSAEGTAGRNRRQVTGFGRQIPGCSPDAPVDCCSGSPPAPGSAGSAVP